MARLNTKDKFIDGLFLTIWVVVTITGVFWVFFKNNQDAKDILGIFGTIVTVIGFWIGLWQLAKLRDEKEIVQDTKVLEKIDDIKQCLTDVINTLSINITNKQTINNCIVLLNSVQRKSNRDLYRRTALF